METPKKHSTNQVQEPTEILYKSTSKSETEMHPVLVKLIEQSKAESKARMGIPHEEVMKMVNLKYPFLK